MSWEGQSAEHRLLPARLHQCLPILHHWLCSFGVCLGFNLPDKLKPVWGGGNGSVEGMEGVRRDGW